MTPRLATEARAPDRPSGGGGPTAVGGPGPGRRPRSRRHRLRYRVSALCFSRGEALHARLPAVRCRLPGDDHGNGALAGHDLGGRPDLLVTAGLLAVPGAGSM